MRQAWKFALLLLVTWTLCQYATSKKTKQTKLLKKLSHVGRLRKDSQPKSETGQKKNSMHLQSSHDQVAAMQNPESLQASEADILNHLENFNKHYINNEMASETALLADNGIDDDSALKISNMAALPNGMPHGAAGVNAAIKAKINSAQRDESNEQKQASNSPGGYDPNAYLYDANSWPEYRIHDSDYSNFHAVEMSNMNGEDTDMPPMYNRPNESPEMGFQNMGGQGGMEYPEGQKFPQGKVERFNDEVKVEKGEALQNEPKEESHSQESSDDKASNAKAAASSGEVKPADNSGASGESKEQSGAKLEAKIAQQSQQQPKPENNVPAAAKEAALQKQQTNPEPQQQQQQQAAKSTPAKLAASVAQAAASLPPKAIASLVSSLVGGGKAPSETVGEGQGQIQKDVVRSSSQAQIPQDVNPAETATQPATKLHKVAMPQKH